MIRDPDREQAAAPTARALVAARPLLRADAMDGLLLEGVPLAAVARAHGTPCWVYGGSTLRARLRRLRAAMPGVAVHYAVKALDTPAVLALIAGEAAGADVVSGGELRLALAAGFPPARIVFSGVGKTAGELACALDAGVGQINVESPEELGLLSAIAAGRGLAAPVALRVNPDVDAGTHPKIATGRAQDKFGIAAGHAAATYAWGAGLPGIAMRGLAVHIGSQILSASPYRDAYAVVAGLATAIRGAGLPLHAVDCGGGLGVPCRDEAEMLPEAWFATMARAFGSLGVHLSIEPGRWLVAPAGVLLAQVIRTRREGLARPIVVLDAAMGDLLRPALYDAWHGIVPVAAAAFHAEPEIADIVGPICESSDVFAQRRALPPLPDGALVAILDAGAYGSVMSSTYNARPLAAQVLIDGRPRLIRRRGTMARADDGLEAGLDTGLMGADFA